MYWCSIAIMVDQGEFIAIITIVVISLLLLIVRLSRCWKRLTGTDLLEVEVTGYTYKVNDSGREEVFRAPRGDIVKAPSKHINEKGEHTNWFGNHKWMPSSIESPTSLSDIQGMNE